MILCKYCGFSEQVCHEEGCTHALVEHEAMDEDNNSPGGGTKFDTDKVEVGLIPWTMATVHALRGIVIPQDANADLTSMVSAGQFRQALYWLFASKKVTIDSVIRVLTGGAKRYGYFNWKGLDPLRVYNAAVRHSLHIGTPDFEATHEDQTACCLLFLLHFDWQPNDKKTD